MIHYKKSFSTYLFFASSLIGLRSEMSNLKCFGTDGEEALYTAFKCAYPGAIHLLCSLHMKRNIKFKLRELGVGEQLQQVVIADVLGKQVSTQWCEGLLNSENSEEYDRGLAVLTKKWESAYSDQHEQMCTFGRWLYKHKDVLTKTSMLKSTRRSAGLGDPPTHFTTNASESMNAVLKNKVDYKKSELPVFVDKLQSVIDEQERELERAVIDRGKYKLCEQFKKLEVKEEDWFMKMTLAQRKRHVQRVVLLSHDFKNTAPRSSSLSAVAENVIDSNKPTCSRYLFPEKHSSESTNKALSVDVLQFSGSVLIPKTVLDAIWVKACDLLNDTNAMCTVPGRENSKDRMVKSNSGPRPHIVTARKTGQYVCECPNWKSLRICSHSVAAAEDNGDLSTYVSWLKKAKQSPNLTKLALSQMPKGRGQKGGMPPRKR